MDKFWLHICKNNDAFCVLQLVLFRLACQEAHLFRVSPDGQVVQTDPANQEGLFLLVHLEILVRHFVLVLPKMNQKFSVFGPFGKQQFTLGPTRPVGPLIPRSPGGP